MRREDRSAAITGSIIGFVVVAYALVYLPMRHNYLQCGRVTLCASVDTHAERGDVKQAQPVRVGSAVLRQQQTPILSMFTSPPLKVRLIASAR
jgi:hypothetical protein